MLMLRAPEFGNTLKLVPNTIQHRNPAGELRTYQGTRPQWQGFNVSFTALNEEKIEQFKNLVISSRGQVITLVDFEQRRWVGIITTPILEISVGRSVLDSSVENNTETYIACNYATSFEFEGTVTSTL